MEKCFASGNFINDTENMTEEQMEAVVEYETELYKPRYVGQ